MASNKAGKVTQVLGAVVDVAFEGELPPILNALSTKVGDQDFCLLYTSPSPRDLYRSRMPSSA